MAKSVRVSVCVWDRERWERRRGKKGGREKEDEVFKDETGHTAAQEGETRDLAYVPSFLLILDCPTIMCPSIWMAQCPFKLEGPLNLIWENPLRFLAENRTFNFTSSSAIQTYCPDYRSG